MKNTIIALLTIVLLAVSSVAFAAEFSLGDIGAVSFAAVSPLIFALAKGNLSKAKELLDDWGKEEDRYDIITKTEIKEAKLLLKHNAGYMDENSPTALMLAAMKGQIEAVKFLLKHGANKDCTGRRCKTALMLAAETGQIKVVKMLLEEDIEKINRVDERGDTALMLAARNNHVEVIVVLKKGGADMSKSNKLGETALILAARNGNEEVMGVLIE